MCGPNLIHFSVVPPLKSGKPRVYTQADHERVSKQLAEQRKVRKPWLYKKAARRVRKPEEGLLDDVSLAAYLGVSVSTVARMLADGLPKVEVRGAVRFNLEEVLKCLTNPGQQSPSLLTSRREEILIGSGSPTQKRAKECNLRQGKPTLKELTRELGRFTKQALNGDPVTEANHGVPVALSEVAVNYLLNHENILDEFTRKMRAIHFDAHLSKAFPSLLDVFQTEKVEEYYSTRLGKVLRVTLTKEVCSLRRLCLYAYKKKILTSMPVFPPVPNVLGTASSKPQRVKAGMNSPEDIQSIIELLPEYSEKWNGINNDGKRVQFPIRSRFIVAYDCCRRPSTLNRLSAPEHWRPGSDWLQVPARLMKAKKDSLIPLTPRAKAALESIYKGPGLLFGKHDYRGQLKKAAKKVMGKERGERFIGQHFRSAKITHVLDAGAPLTAAAYLADHTQVSTTSIYARPSLRALLAELKRQGIPAPSTGDASPVEGSGQLFPASSGTVTAG